MSVITWLLLGLIFGFTGSKVLKRAGKGLRVDTALGVVGALAGGMVFSMSCNPRATDLDLWSLLAAVTGTCLVLFVKQAIVMGQRRVT
jgi:uncharacterized membrane protein YeaQ/YmgE (transglycosylase-associated protein family)